MRLHLAAVYYVVLAGFFFGVKDPSAWAALFVTCGAVIGAEALNSALERLCDAMKPDPSPAVGAVKDIAAGGVLACAVAAVCVAFAVFWGRPVPPGWLGSPALWAGAAGAPFWIWFTVSIKR
jgi:diacylglycerol kinase (ATP)